MGVFCRYEGRDWSGKVWRDVPERVALQVAHLSDWEVEGLTKTVVVEETPVVEEVVEESEVVEETNDEDSPIEPSMTMTKAELQQMCDDAGIAYESSDSKRALLTLLTTVGEEE
jgi:CO dehydrogenase/acetyl-CoA synthase beta subunit